MDTEIVTLANVSWLQFPDRQALASRMISQHSNRLKSQFGRPSKQVLEHLPLLDWPARLFADDEAR